ncbi:ABC transporter ATP-binding protein [Aeromicrobium sp. PE09-221]|uniref:ABC transporter ATP-binding protein n=1 Tax=Aeromicrobium sp. PE09-221 TaxID=1898043 RepID=UPI000B3E8753|nr:ATP-binding cassette domain-containing protein [Aeromicrobium sp. PE09-221]OUZ12802.1 ABC transporter ATP-binding protein [Aeromicrobium sp. PE09-221]
MPRLDVDALSKSYGTVQALTGTTFSVAAGEVFGFVGSNGSGKTTTMRIILGVLTADDGEVRWDGQPVDAAVRRRIGYMPEERGLYPKMKVGDQLTYLARLYGLSGADAKEAMARWTERLGVAERVDDEVQKLSLGNQQRVQLAAALTHSPDLLVLDEPFSGLDPVAVEVMSHVLAEESERGAPVLFSSHQLDLVERLCDRVGIIKNGRMVAVGTLDELRRTDKPRWIIDGPPGDDWLGEVRRARIVSREGTRTVVEVEADGDEQPVLQAALRLGPVREFSLSRPSLTDLYRHVVSSEDPGEGEGTR